MEGLVLAADSAVTSMIVLSTIHKQQQQQQQQQQAKEMKMCEMKRVCHLTSEPLQPCWAPGVTSFVHNAVLLTGCCSPFVHNTYIHVHTPAACLYDSCDHFLIPSSCCL